MKAVLTGEFMILNAYLRKEERSKKKNQTFYLRKLEKDQIKEDKKTISEIIEM